MRRLLADARVIAAHFALEYRAIEPERANVKSRYGICYDDGTIRIRLMHAVSGKPLKYSSLVSTLCHELAHLRHFDHGPKFRAFNQEVLEWARRRGIYRPGTSSAGTGTAEIFRGPAAPDLGAAIRSGKLPTLGKSLRGVLPERPADFAVTRDTPYGTRGHAHAPRQLELFGSPKSRPPDARHEPGAAG